jgi:NADH-quinone oxidoreductase subunit L
LVAAVALLVDVESAPAVVHESVVSWTPTGGIFLGLGTRVDGLAAVVAVMVCVVALLVQVYSTAYMAGDPRYSTYAAEVSLFTAAMLLVVVASDLFELLVGWEVMGLCSYLLIGHYWQTEGARAAAVKAFVTTRIGDTGFLFGIFVLGFGTGSFEIGRVVTAAHGLSHTTVTAGALLLLAGVVGKSAQFPLHVWLPDAMAGPTPVSVLIHAATMVTAGVYLIVRSSFLFSMSPIASITVAVVGAVTALSAATIAMKQWDIKKVLAYSTISQLGYMFVGVGVGAYTAGIFHLATHAFFKALLFLGAGSVIHVMHVAYHHSGSHDDAQDMRNMGGMRKAMPVTWIVMWIATLAISGIPPFAGFFSKDSILGSVYEHAGDSVLTNASWLGMSGHTVLLAVYVIGLAAAFLTAVYMTRLMLYTFHGPSRASDDEQRHMHEAPWLMTGPLVVLGALSLVGGWLNLPSIMSFLGPVGGLDHWLEPVVGAATRTVTNGAAMEAASGTEAVLVGLAIVIAVLGIAVAVFALKPASLVPKAQSPAEHGFEKVLANKYYVDEAYDDAVVRPVLGLSKNVFWRGLDAGIIDNLFVNGSAALARGLGWIGARIQTGSTGVYAWAIVVGAIVVLSAFSFR